jgi:hypothetical protein
MSLADVEALLGEPYRAKVGGSSTSVWRGKAVVISLDFYADWLDYGEAFSPGENVDHIEYIRPGDESILDRIRRWLHL